MSNVTIAFLITLFAGLATGIGSLIAFLARNTNKKFLSISLGFSAGVMIYVSMIEIFPKAKDSLVLALGERAGNYLTVISFEVKSLPTEGSNEKNTSGLLRTGVFTALAIGIHNFPEGLATFVSALGDMKIAIPIAVAIAIHNIPEGISVSVPIYYATGDKKKAFIYSFLSGMSEPIGAIVGYVFLRNYFNDLTFGIIFAMVAGIMVFISLDELLPAAKEYGEHHLSIYGLILGMIVMAVSLLLFI